MRLRGGWEAVGWRSEWNANFRRGSFNRGAIRPRRFPPERGVPPVHSTISAEPAGSVPEPSLNLPARSVQTRLTGHSDIVRFSGRPGTGVSLSAFDLMSYSNRNRELVKTNVDVRAKMKTCLGGDFRVAANDSQHRMAKNIRDLGLDGAKPFLVQRSDHFQARLNAGRKIAPWEPST